MLDGPGRGWISRKNPPTDSLDVKRDTSNIERAFAIKNFAYNEDLLKRLKECTHLQLPFLEKPDIRESFSKESALRASFDDEEDIKGYISHLILSFKAAFLGEYYESYHAPLDEHRSFAFLRRLFGSRVDEAKYGIGYVFLVLGRALEHEGLEYMGLLIKAEGNKLTNNGEKCMREDIGLFPIQGRENEFGMMSLSAPTLSLSPEEKEQARHRYKLFIKEEVEKQALDIAEFLRPRLGSVKDFKDNPEYQRAAVLVSGSAEEANSILKSQKTSQNKLFKIV